MSQKEYQNISDFIKGTLTKEKREEISKQIKKETSDIESNKMKTDDKQVFNPDKAWNKFQNKIVTEGLLNEKTGKVFTIRNIAASIILLIGLSVTGYIVFNNYAQTQFTEINSANSIKDVLLPDGSQITLNQNSTIRYPEKFTSNKRTVEFTGEAFFNIAKNTEKPFIIKTNKAEVTVLGTSFNVITDKKENIKVTVKTGKVQLANKKKESIVINPKEIGKFENNTLSKAINNDKNYLSWKTKCFEYDGEYLSNVINDFNKVYHVEITLEDLEIGKLLIKSSPQNKTIDVALSLICTPHNLEYKHDKEGKIIISKKNTL